MSIKGSVIIPVYNAEKYLAQTLDSVLSQSLRDIEVICVDDGSSDRSLEILHEYEKKDNRVIVISQENGGAGKARNTGLEVAKGEYLSFLDADDFFDPDMLSKAYTATAGNMDIVVFRCDQYREDLDKYFRTDWTLRVKDIPPYRPAYFRNFTDNVFKVVVGWAWDKLFRTEFVRENGLQFQEIRSSNDMLFVFTAIVLARKVEIVDEVLAHHRSGDPTSLSNTREKSWDCFYKALTALKDNLIKYGYYRELEQDYINYALHFSLWHLNTITGEKKEVLFDKLKNEWFAEFGVSDKDKDYFYIKGEYDNYKLVMDSSFSKYCNIKERQ